MNRAISLCISLSSGLLLTAFSATAQSPSGSGILRTHSTPEPATSSSVAVTASAPATTRLASIVFDEPATEEGFATVRIADETGETVYRGMVPVAAGARSLDLSNVRIPAAVGYTLRVVYPGGTVVQEVETAHTIAARAAARNVVAGR